MQGSIDLCKSVISWAGGAQGRVGLLTEEAQVPQFPFGYAPGGQDFLKSMFYSHHHSFDCVCFFFFFSPFFLMKIVFLRG